MPPRQPTARCACRHGRFSPILIVRLPTNPPGFALSVREGANENAVILRTLGGLALLQDGKELQVQRARLAILIVVAEAGAAGISRERVSSLLWPDSDASRARNSLNQGLHALRQAAPSGDLISGSGVLRMNVEACRVDFVEFDRAVQDQNYAEAVSLYNGPFLDGIHFRYGEAFERWVETIRARLETAHSSSLRALLSEAAEANDLRRSVDITRVLAAKDPLDAIAAADLVTALSRLGDRSAAMRHVEIYEQLAVSEIGSADPLVRAALQVPPPRAAENALPPPRVDAPTPASPERESGKLAQDPNHGTRETIRGAGAARFSWRWRIVAFVSLAAILIALAFFAPSQVQSKISAVGTRQTVAIFPACVSDSSLFSVAGHLEDLLISSLADLKGPTPRKEPPDGNHVSAPKGCTTDASEVRVNTGQYKGLAGVYPRLTMQNGRIIFSADVRRAHRGSLDASRVFVESGPPDSVALIAQRLANSIGASLINEPAHHSPDLSARSVAAVRFYLIGRAALRANRKNDAVAAFWHALDADTTFALAVLGLAESGRWDGGNSLVDRRRKGVATLATLRDKLLPRDRALFDAIAGPAGRRWSSLEQLRAWERVTEFSDDSPQGWYELGDALFHTGDALGAPDARIRAKAAFESAVALDSSSAGPLAHLLEIAIDRRDAADVEKYALLYFTADPDGEIVPFLKWRIAVFRQNSHAIESIRRALPSMSGPSLRRIAGYSDLLPADHSTGVLAIDSWNHRFSSLPEQLDALSRLHDMALNAGDFTRVDSSIEALRKMEPIEDGFLRDVVDADALLVTDALFANRPVPGAVISRLRAAAVKTSLKSGRDAVQYIGDNCALGLWEARLGTPALAQGAARRLASPPDNADSAKAHSAQGELCRRMIVASLDVKAGSKTPNSLRELDQLAAEWTWSFGAGFANLLTAKLYHEAGERGLALRAVRRRRYDWTEGIRYLAPSRALERELLSSH